MPTKLGSSTFRRRSRSSSSRAAKEAATSSAFRKPWAQLSALGCTYEGADDKLLSIDVPPHADIDEVYALLEAGEESGTWDFEEGHCGHPLTTSSST
jgi:Domain of unknown function (DUF4265)